MLYMQPAAEQVRNLSTKTGRGHYCSHLICTGPRSCTPNLISSENVSERVLSVCVVAILGEVDFALSKCVFTQQVRPNGSPLSASGGWGFQTARDHIQPKPGRDPASSCG